MKPDNVVRNRLSNQIMHIRNEKRRHETSIAAHEAGVQECHNQLNWLEGFKREWEAAREEEKPDVPERS